MTAPRRDRSFGEIPLSSSEIELYSRQDEITRRRRLLLSVRDQERRLAQQVTQRYRNNLQQLQRKRRHKLQKHLSDEQQKMRTELHVDKQNSVQSMGTGEHKAQELMVQAQKEKDTWTDRGQMTGKQWTIEAKKAQEETERVIETARRRQGEQNMERLLHGSDQQRRRVSARARQEQDVAWEQINDKKEMEKLRRMQGAEEVFGTPRPRQNDDVESYRFSRTHCLSTTTSRTERPALIRQNRKHPTARRRVDEAMKYRDDNDQKGKQDQLDVEAQQETDRNAHNDVKSRRQREQPLVDTMEQRARGKEVEDEEEYLLDAGGVNGGIDKSERKAERAFAQMLGLDEDSVELSVFSIISDDERSVTLVDPDPELSNGDEVARADLDYRIKLKATTRSSPFDLRDRSEFGGPVKSGKREQDEHKTPGKPVKTTRIGYLQREEFEKLKISEDTRQSGIEGVRVPSEAHSESDADNDNFYNKDRLFDRASCRNVVIAEDKQLPVSTPCRAPIQKSLSHIDQVAYDMARSLKQRCVDQHMRSTSGSERLNEGESEAEEAESHMECFSVARSSVNVSPCDPYRKQTRYNAPRSSTSAVSVAQYSLASSDTQSSFEESLDQLHPGHDDSFVNGLVPMFPKHPLPPPPRSFEADNKAFEEYEDLILAPNMSRMLASERPRAFGQSEQCLIHENHPIAVTDYLRCQRPASTTMQTDRKHPSTTSAKRTLSASACRRSYS